MAWDLEEIKEYVKNSMSEKRFKHVLGVVETAIMLAKRHSVNVDDATRAALLHDVVKEQNLEEAKQILHDKNELGYLEYSSKIWHAPLGGYVASEVFGIENEAIINAIRFHTTGREGMSDLEKVLFVADYTEPNRTFAGAIAVREFWDDLDRAIFEIAKQKIEKNSKLGGKLHPDTLATYEFYKI